jgi:transcriptional repressor NrdR
MKCPFCRSNDTEVYNTRTTKFATQIWRRRRCLSCHEAFTTYEAPDLGFLRVTGSAGKHRYSRAQLFYSLSEAFGAPGGHQGTIDAVTDTLEAKILDLKSPTITTEQIARIILTTLKHFSTPAFLRYLSTHAELASNAALKKELKKY